MVILAQATTQVSTELSFWAQTAHDIIVQLALLAVPVVCTFLVTFLRNQSKKAAAEADKAQVEKGKVVVDRAKAYALDAAATLAEQRFPELARKIVASGGKMTQDQIKAELMSWGVDLQQKTIQYFQQQGVDLKGQIGDQGVADIVAIAANKASPFPGQETSQVLVKPENAKVLLEKGVTYAKESVGQFKADYDHIKLGDD